MNEHADGIALVTTWIAIALLIPLFFMVGGLLDQHARNGDVRHEFIHVEGAPQ